MAENEDLTQIIKGCKDGDAQCFSELVDRYAKRLYGYFYRATGSRDVSDELLSRLFVRLVEKIGTYRDGIFESWLFKTAANIFYDYLRQKRRNKRLLDSYQKKLKFEKQGTKQLFNEKSEELDKLQIKLKNLDADTRELIMLRYYSQFSFKQIAAMRSEPIGTVLSRVHRGLKKLRAMMDDYADGK